MRHFNALPWGGHSRKSWVRGWARWIVLAGMVALIVVGCQSSGRSPQSIPTVLKLSGWGSSPIEQRLLNQVLREFEQTHPTIQVKFETIADQYMDVLKTRLIGDAAPDVFYLDALEAPFLMESGVLEPLNPYIDPAFDLTDFEPNLLQAFTLEKTIYGLPKDYSTLALFYNKSAFSDAGLDRPPTTWDELQRDSQALTIDGNQDGKPDQYGFGVVPELARQVYKIQAFGGQVVDQNGYATFASEKGLRGLQEVVEQYQGNPANGETAPDRTAARPLDVGANSSSEMFGQGKAAMVIEGNWAIPYLADTFPSIEYGTVEIPQTNDQPGTMVYTVAYVMNRDSLHKPEAWELIAYLTGKVGMEQWTSTGFALPTRRSVAATLRFDQDPLRAALVAGVKYATPWQIGPYPGAIMNHFNNQFISVMLGQRPLKEALQEAQADANRQIKAAE